MKTEGAKKLWERYKYIALVALAGIILLALPTGEQRVEEQETAPATILLQQEMEQILSAINGVGQVKVLLTVDSDGERQLARDTEVRSSGGTAEEYSSSTVLLDGEVGDEPLVVRTLYPTYRGALVVCTGGGDPKVRLTVTEAVTALTGLSADRVTVAKWQ